MLILILGKYSNRSFKERSPKVLQPLVVYIINLTNDLKSILTLSTDDTFTVSTYIVTENELNDDLNKISTCKSTWRINFNPELSKK